MVGLRLHQSLSPTWARLLFSHVFTCSKHKRGGESLQEQKKKLRFKQFGVCEGGACIAKMAWVPFKVTVVLICVWVVRPSYYPESPWTCFSFLFFVRSVWRHPWITSERTTSSVWDSLMGGGRPGCFPTTRLRSIRESVDWSQVAVVVSSLLFKIKIKSLQICQIH